MSVVGAPERALTAAVVPVRIQRCAPAGAAIRVLAPGSTRKKEGRIVVTTKGPWAMEGKWSSSVRDVPSVDPVLAALDGAGHARYAKHHINDPRSRVWPLN